MGLLFVQALPPLLVPYLRLAHAASTEELARPGLLDASPGNRVISVENEQAVLHQLLLYFERRLSQCAATLPPVEAVAVAMVMQARRSAERLSGTWDLS